tara:strand:+ start:109 stop:540 length:432 start_codon:yes stop_codon:yes gene_type:complete
MKPGGGRMKGATFEREVAGLLFDELGIKFKREIEQYRQADLGDLVPCDGTFPFTIECKRYADGYLAKDAWWDQACAAAKAANLIPSLVYRFDRRPIICRIPIQAFVLMSGSELDYGWTETADVTFSAYCMVSRELLALAAESA